MNITIGVRKSIWALAATDYFINKAQGVHPHIDFQVIQLDSPGDLNQGDLAKLGGTTAFVDALSKEVAAGKVDACVHTVKDISWPSDLKNFPVGDVLPKGLRSSGNLLLCAISDRSDPRDALVMRVGEKVSDFIGRQLRIGTGSLVRAAVIRQLLPESKLVISRVRGNIDVRLGKLDNGDYDALILSMDGLNAVKKGSRASRIFSIEEMPPALCQGIGAMESSEKKTAVVDVMQSITSAATTRILRAEWAAMKAVGATCYTPISGLCTESNGSLDMFAVMYDSNGGKIVARGESSDLGNPEALGKQIGEQLVAQGAKAIEQSWESVRGELSQDAC